MAMLEHSHVRIPPDSTGKRMLHSMYMIIHYQYAQDEMPGFGELIVGSESGARATIVYVDTSNTMSNGNIGVMSDKFSDVPFQTGDILLIHGNHHGVVVGCTPFYQPYTHIAGGNDTVNLVQIDNKGSMYTRYAEGEPQMDAFSNLKISDATKLGEYSFLYDLPCDKFHFDEEVGGTVTYEEQSKGLCLRNGTAANSKSSVTTHQYHKYEPGVGQTIQCTVAAGDEGKENVIRRWGYFDDKDGIFFELNQHTIYAVVRSSVSGSVVEYKTPRSDWNRDRLTGLGGHYNYSRHALDVTKNTIYEIDFQWLGAGTVRFFVNVSGARVPVHEVHHSGKLNRPYMRSGTLPFRVEQINLSESASTSEIRFFTATVVTDGKHQAHHRHFSMGPSIERTISGPDPTPHASFRLKDYIGTTENRGEARIKKIGLYSTTKPVIIEVLLNAELTGATWSRTAGPESISEIDNTATAAAGGKVVLSRILHPGEAHEIDTSHVFCDRSEFAIRRLVHVEDYNSVTITAKSLDGEATDIYMTAEWEEMV